MKTSWFAFVLAFVSTQAPAQGQVSLPFPDFVNGDGRQSLAEFQGHAVLLVTFAEVWGGLAGLDRGTKLLEEHADDGLVVIASHVPTGSTFGDGASGVDLGSWVMRKRPGSQVLFCGDVRSAWKFEGDLPPNYAVFGPDGVLVRQGDLQKGTSDLDKAVDAALRMAVNGWGRPEEAAVRALLRRGSLAVARAKAGADPALLAEVDAAFARRTAGVEWLLGDGQWMRGKASADALVGAATGVTEWEASVQALVARFADDAGKRELDLDGKLSALLKPLAQKAPERTLPRRLRELGTKASGTTVGTRIERVAKVVDGALAMH